MSYGIADFAASMQAHGTAAYRFVDRGTALARVGGGQLSAGLAPAAAVQGHPAVILAHLLHVKQL